MSPSAAYAQVRLARQLPHLPDTARAFEHVPVLGACVAGWFLAVQMTAIGLERRGFPLPSGFRLLRRHRLAIGFGVAVFLPFRVPLAAQDHDRHVVG